MVKNLLGIALCALLLTACGGGNNAKQENKANATSLEQLEVSQGHHLQVH